MPRYVVPDTVEQALELLENGLLYRNWSNRIPRDPLRWEIANNSDTLLREELEDTYNNQSARLSSKWHYTDFAYVLED